MAQTVCHLAILKNCRGLGIGLIFGLASLLLVPQAPAQVTGPKGGTVLLIRHAEKPEEGDGLTAAGETRARAYIDYFQTLKSGPDTLRPDVIFATADSRNSRRPRLTVEPLAKALGLPVHTDYKDKDFAALAEGLRNGYEGKHILVCWHHGSMAGLLKVLGADPAKLLPEGSWPKDEYDWLLVLRYDAAGHLQEASRVEEGLTGSRPR